MGRLSFELGEAKFISNWSLVTGHFSLGTSRSWRELLRIETGGAFGLRQSSGALT
jgi:hypothetical protein